MAFDPRSLERLKELGRRLPQPLPVPAQPPLRPQYLPANGATGWKQKPTPRPCSTN